MALATSKLIFGGELGLQVLNGILKGLNEILTGCLSDGAIINSLSGILLSFCLRSAHWGAPDSSFKACF